jgi:hypothetical protein
VEGKRAVSCVDLEFDAGMSGVQEKVRKERRQTRFQVREERGGQGGEVRKGKRWRREESREYLGFIDVRLGEEARDDRSGGWRGEGGDVRGCGAGSCFDVCGVIAVHVSAVVAGDDFSSERSCNVQW